MQTKRVKWFWTLVMTMSLAWIALSALAVEKQPSEGKVAIVNGSVITKEDFDREMSLIQQRFSSMRKPLSDSQLSKIKKDVLENLINRELLYQESQKKEIKVDEEAINEQLRRMKKRFPSEEEFENALSKMNLSEADLKSRLTRGMAVQQLINKQIVQKVTVSEEEIKAYYDSHPDFFKEPEQVQASHILIKVDPQADESKKTEALKQLEMIQQKLQKGEDFAALAREFSQGPSKAKGGDLGYFKRGQMAKPFEEAAFALRPGEVSDIVETKFGYHLIKVTGKKAETAFSYEVIKDKLQQYLKQQKARKQLNSFIEELKGKAKVERFPTETSK